MTAPIKTCDYCYAVGVMPTFMDGETVCYDCLSTLPKTMREARSEIVSLRTKIEAMEKPVPIAHQGKVPDGWPTEEMTTAFARVFNVRDQYGTFPQAFRAALTVAPEAKGEFKKQFASPPRSMIEDSVKEAGISDVPFDFQIVSLEDLERFAAIISKHERDACYEIAQSELRNMSALMSNPPKSGAAWEIACRIQARNNP